MGRRSFRICDTVRPALTRHHLTSLRTLISPRSSTLCGLQSTSIQIPALLPVGLTLSLPLLCHSWYNPYLNTPMFKVAPLGRWSDARLHPRCKMRNAVLTNQYMTSTTSSSAVCAVWRGRAVRRPCRVL